MKHLIKWKLEPRAKQKPAYRVSAEPGGQGQMYFSHCLLQPGILLAPENAKKLQVL